MKIPEDYQTVTPYLIVNGADNFIDFTKKVFKAVENEKMRSMRNEKIILHSEIRIGESTTMLSDSTEEFGPVLQDFSFMLRMPMKLAKKRLTREQLC